MIAVAVLSPFFPSILKDKITDITLRDLELLGVRGLLLDVDNTLTAPKSQHLEPEVEAWLSEMKSAGIELTIVSNALPRRVIPFANKLGLRCIAFSCKPSPIGFIRGARRIKLKRKQCAAVGDQTFTDILGSKLAGVRSIQVIPMAVEHQFTLKLKRRFEKIILNSFRKKQSRKGG